MVQNSALFIGILLGIISTNIWTTAIRPAFRRSDRVPPPPDRHRR